MATKTISITVDDETLDIIKEAKQLHAQSASSAFRILMKEHRDREYVFKGKENKQTIISDNEGNDKKESII
jgi:hypothetical protein